MRSPGFVRIERGIRGTCVSTEYLLYLHREITRGAPCTPLESLATLSSHERYDLVTYSLYL